MERAIIKTKANFSVSQHILGVNSCTSGVDQFIFKLIFDNKTEQFYNLQFDHRILITICNLYETFLSILYNVMNCNNPASRQP